MAKKYLVINKTTDEIEMIADDEDSAYTFIKFNRLNYEDFSIEKVEMKYFGKSIIISINPKWVCKILNGEKTLEIRKLFPKDYVGWIFIYVTKDGPYLYPHYEDNGALTENGTYREWQDGYELYAENNGYALNGKVVAKFWCNKVEEIKQYPSQNAYDEWFDEYNTRSLTAVELRKKSCLTYQELNAYLGYKVGYAIHITRLRIFTKPMELTMFRKVGFRKARMENGKYKKRQSVFELLREWSLTKAPQSWQYIED